MSVVGCTTFDPGCTLMKTTLMFLKQRNWVKETQHELAQKTVGSHFLRFPNLYQLTSITQAPFILSTICESFTYWFISNLWTISTEEKVAKCSESEEKCFAIKFFQLSTSDFPQWSCTRWETPSKYSFNFSWKARNFVLKLSVTWENWRIFPQLEKIKLNQRRKVCGPRIPTRQASLFPGKYFARSCFLAASKSHIA